MFDLQLFAEAVQGKQLVYLYRIQEEAGSENGTILAFTTDNSKSTSKDADSTATKDGSIRSPGEAEIEITAESILVKDDPTVEALEDAMLNDKLLEIWEANLAEPSSDGNNKFNGTYYQGYLTSVEKDSSADGFVTVSLSFGINGTGAKGDVTVTTEQQEAAQYVFTDTLPTSS